MKIVKEVEHINCDFLSTYFITEIMMCICFIMGVIVFNRFQKERNIKNKEQLKPNLHQFQNTGFGNVKGINHFNNQDDLFFPNDVTKL